MFKIEKTLLLKGNVNDLTFKAVIKEFLKEANMLISNIHLTHIYLKKDVGNLFPLETNKYDGSWYKNIFVAAEIIIDRLHSRIEENKDYLKPFNDIYECDFVAFAKKWNKINFMVKYNLSDEEWESLCKNYNIYATSRKLEEIIAKNVSIDLKLLQSLSLDMNEYRSIAKKLDEEQRNDLDSLISKLVPATIEASQNEGVNLGDKAQALPQPAPAPVGPVKPVKEKGPLSPTKKEMDQILKWIKIREEEIKAFKATRKKGYDSEEYKHVVEQLEKVKEELKLVDGLLNEASKVKMPLDPLARELSKIEKWSRDRESDIKKFLKANKTDNTAAEYKNVNDYLDKVSEELEFINHELSNTKVKMPLDPLAKELNKLLGWIKGVEGNVRAYKRQQRQESINDELRLIEKELAIVHQKSDDISTTINFINQQRPVDPYKKELDQLLRWISTKESDIRKLKALTLKKEREMKSLLIEQVRKEYEDVNEEIKRCESLIGINNDLEYEKLATISKRELLERLRKEMIEIDEQIAENKKLLKKQVLLESKQKPVEDNVEKIEIVNHLDEEKLYELAEIYDIEAAVLKTAISVMPEHLRKFGEKALPSMLQHLLESGYIEIKKDYKLVNPDDQYKLRHVAKASK